MLRTVLAHWLWLSHLAIAQELFTPITRPDIHAPTWNIDIYDKDALAPGYWFVAPYHALIQHDYPFWNGPHIYDSEGQLIWGGASFVKYYNTFDFRMSVVDGKQMLSFIWPKNSEKQEAGFILDEHYEVHKLLDMRGDMKRPNMHDFNLIDDGKRALMLKTPYQNDDFHISIPGEFEGTCRVDWQGFKELDVETGEIVFDWDVRGHIGVEESTYFTGNPSTKYDRMCSNFWDITHVNAIDKFTDGDYLLSARHMDTIYKVSHKDGSIVWRLGGVKSDFVFTDQRAIFSRQHHVRFRGQNSTHTLVSVFDNAVGDFPALASSSESWGLLLALRTDTDPMTVELAARYQRPHEIPNPLEKSRGSVQYLENGNALVGWVTGSAIAEYTHDGKMLMQAMFKRQEAASYRSYKFPWVGRPLQAPDVVSSADELQSGKLVTAVHVSWNGDTEAKTWNLLRTNPKGDVSELIDSKPRRGFETKLEVDGYMKHIVAVALDVNGREIGRSNVTATYLPPRLQNPSLAAEESRWIASHSSAWQAGVSTQAHVDEKLPHRSLFSLLVFGALTCVVTFLLLRRKKLWRSSRRQAYHSLADDDEEDKERRSDYYVDGMDK